MILSGILLTPTGEPYKNSSVRITANNTSEQVLMFVQKDFKTGVDGSYSVDVPNGWYYVSVYVNDYRSFTNIGNIEITDDTTQTTINELLMLDQTAHSDGLAQQVADNAASALASKNAAAVSATQATTSASQASASATNAQNSANSASTSASSAITKASEAGASAQDAQNSADLTASLLSTKVSVSDLENQIDPNKGAKGVGYFPSYPGAGAIGGDLASILDERVSASRFGISSSNSATTNVDRFQKFLISAASNGFVAELPYELTGANFNAPVYVDYTMISNQKGVSIIGSSTRQNILNYSGSGHFINITGLGTEGGTPITQFQLGNFRVTGGNNSTSTGAIYLDRVNRVRMFGLSADSFASPTSRIMEIRNYFNVDLSMFNISGGATLPQGQYGLVYGSKNSGVGDEWNSSNLTVRQGLIQRMAGKGAVLIHDNNICDNVEFDNVSFGANSQGSLSCVSDKMHNFSVHHCHFESAGTQPNGSFVPSVHVNVALLTGFELKNNEFKDAQTHAAIDQVKGFDVAANNVYESGQYTINSSVGFAVTGTSGNRSQGRIALNNVYTTQIDEPYTTDTFSDVDPGTHNVTEGAWNSVYASRPNYYGKNLLFRNELNTSNPDGEFDRVWLSPESRWLRVTMSSRHVGWGTTFPTTGSYTQGDIVFNEAPSNQGSNTIYTNLGWRRLTTGSNHVANVDWVALRCITGLVSFSAAFNSPEPLRLGGNYWWHDTFNMPRTKASAPTTATDGNPFGMKVAVPSTATSSGAPGQWAVDPSFAYFYSGDGSTHTWRRVAVVSW